jgi:DNA polymerase/3'-5' exonuclease PolX
VSDKTRIPLADADWLAEEVVDLLAPFCDRIAVAGSIRRRRPDVGDIEIVAIPKTEKRVADLFGEQYEDVDLLGEAVARFLDEGELKPRPDKNGHTTVNGKSRRLLYCGAALDLFTTDADCWGSIFLLRTGPGEFNKQLVLKASAGGWLPRGFFFKDGRVWKLPPPYDASLVEYAKPVPTPEEEDVFRVLGYEYVPPEQRGERRPRFLRAVAS